MTFARSSALLVLLATAAGSQERTLEASSTRDPQSLTRLDVTAEAQRRFDGFRPGTRFFDGFPGPAPARGRPHVLVAETPERGLAVVREARDLLPLVEAVDTPARAVALCRFLTDPPAGPPLTYFVDLAPRIETPGAVWLFSPVQVQELAGDGPRATPDGQGGFRVERAVVDLQRLTTAREVSRDGEGLPLAPEQSQALETPGATVHLLDVLGTAQERVRAGSYAAATPERVVKVLVVRLPLPRE